MLGWTVQKSGADPTANPIVVVTDANITNGWKKSQTLNIANLPPTAQNPGPILAQPGIRIAKIVLVSNGTTVAGTVNVIAPTADAMPLLPPIAVGGGAGALGTVIYREDFAEQFPNWKDFKVTGLTATVTALFVYYRD